MDVQNLWSKFDRLSLFQCVLLTLGYDPENKNGSSAEHHETMPANYHAIRLLLMDAVITNKIKGEVKFHDYHGENPIDIDETKLEVQSLKEFLKLKNIPSDFFFPDQDIESPDYLNKSHSCFPKKLFAAIRAWEAVTSDPSRLNGKTPKQAVTKYLEDNAKELGLVKRDNTINIEAIKEISKICNWKPMGGATKTRTHLPVEGNPPTPNKKHIELKSLSDIQPQKTTPETWLDGEIPF